MTRHVPATRELDLRSSRPDLLHANTVADRMNALPGFRTSAAFFTFLRANLVLHPTTAHSTMSSSTSTPALDASSSQTLPPPSPAQLPSNTPAPPAAGDRFTNIPPLTTSVLSAADQIDGLKLIADSVAQMRQTASRSLIFSPIFAAIWVAMVAVITRLFYKEWADLGIIACTVGGGTMAMLLVCRALTGGYLAEAEKIGFDFLKDNEQGGADTMFGTKYGDELIGVVVLRLEKPGAGAGNNTSSKKKSKAATKGGKGIIRAWTVILRYRHKGIGTGLLEEAIKATREACGKDAEIVFAADHPNSKMILPELFNGTFRRDEKKAIGILEATVAEMDGGEKKKR